MIFFTSYISGLIDLFFVDIGFKFLFNRCRFQIYLNLDFKIKFISNFSKIK